jgi:tetratricopeptide (TPR) repeat protein
MLTRPPDDPAGREARVRRLCLRGEFLFLTFTSEGLRRSAEVWDQAASLDPGLARVHAGRSMTESVRALLDLVSVADAERLARDGAGRALELEPASPPAQFAGSLVRLLFDWDPDGAAAAARFACGRDSEDPRGPIVLGLALLAEGRLEEGERVLHRGVLLDPNAPALAYLEGRAREMRARWTEASAAYARALVLEPDLAAARRDNAESLAAAGRHVSALRLLAAAEPEAGRRAGGPADAWRRLCSDGATSLETVHACLLGGERARAEQVLAAATESRAPSVVLAPHDALLRPLRRGPAMRELAARLQLASDSADGP